MAAKHLLEPDPRGRPRTTDLRAVVDAIFYLLHRPDGLPVAAVAEGLSAYTTVQRYFHRWREDGRWRRIDHEPLMWVREAWDGRPAPRPGSSTVSR